MKTFLEVMWIVHKYHPHLNRFRPGVRRSIVVYWLDPVVGPIKD